MREAGFVDVEEQMNLHLPLSGWSTGAGRTSQSGGCQRAMFINTATDPRQQAVGVANQGIAHRLMSSLAVLPFSQVLG